MRAGLRHFLPFLFGLVWLSLLGGWTPACAQGRERAVFDVLVGDFRVGLLAFSGVESQGRYSVAGQLRSTGLIGALADVRYSAEARGRIVSGRYIPELYVENSTVGTRSTELVITYDDGIPDPPVFDPPRQTGGVGLDPATQGDAVDVLTLFYTLLKDTSPRSACDFDAFAYDGVRRTQVTMRVETRAPGRVSCAAEYRRIAGFTSAELVDRPVFPFRVVYEGEAGGPLRATSLDVGTVYGLVRLERREED